jgi:hypothetical protein
MTTIETRHNDANTHTHTNDDYNDAIHFATWHTCADCDCDTCETTHVHVKSFNAIKMDDDVRERVRTTSWDALRDDDFDDDAMTLCIDCATRMLLDAIDIDDANVDRMIRELRVVVRAHDAMLRAIDMHARSCTCTYCA